MSHLNADEYVETLDFPTLTVRGRTFTGRLLSFPQAVAMQHLFDGMAERDDSANGITRVIKHLCDTGFPRPWWKFWEPRASTLVLSMPVSVQLRVMESFLESQVAHFQALAPMKVNPATTTTDSTSASDGEQPTDGV